MNETSNMNSNSTGGVCSSCLKEMPSIMSSTTNHSLTKLCSNCMTEFVDQQQLALDLNQKLPFFPSFHHGNQQVPNTSSSSSTIIPSQFSSLPSSSASSTSSSISSSHRRFSGFDPFTSLQPLNDFHLTNNNPSSLFEPNPSNDLFRHFQQFLHGTNDRESPSNHVQNVDFPSALFPPLATRLNNATELPSSFCCYANNPPYTFCLDCESSLCEKCALIHPKMLGFKNHRQQLLGSSSSGKHRSSLPPSIRSAPIDSLPSSNTVRLTQSNNNPFDLSSSRLTPTTNNDLFSSLFSQLSLNTMTTMNSPGETIFCHEHRTIRASFFCDICAHAFCHDCHLHHAQQHTLSSLQETIENARLLSKQFLIESQTLLYHLDESLKQSTRTIENLPIKSSTIENEIRTLINYYLDFLGQRQDYLMKNHDQIATIKTEIFKRQICELNQVIHQLHLTILECNECLKTVNEIDLLRTRHRLWNEIIQMKQTFLLHLKPVEDDFLPFQNPSNPFNKSSSMNYGQLISSTYSPLCELSSDSLSQVHRHRLTVLNLQTRNHLGELRTTGGDQIQSCLIDTGTNQTIPCEIYDRQNGQYFLTFMIQSDNRHVLNVYVNNLPIKDNPFHLEIKNHRNYSTIGLKLEFQIGVEGDQDGRLCRPWGVCCDGQSNIIVADRSNNRIQIFNRFGQFMRKFGSQGTRPGQFDRPAGVAYDKQLNRIIVTDKDNHRVQVFTSIGEFLLKFGEKGTKPGQFNYPWDVAISSTSQILISDTRNHRIQLFSKDGLFLRKYGFDGPIWKQFDSPRGVVFTPAGHMIISDFNNHRLVFLSSDFQTARFLGSEGSADGQFLRPQGVDIDVDGNILVADSRNYRVQIFSPQGIFKCKFGTQGSGPLQMDRPSGLCVTPEGLVLVVDFGNNRILAF